MTENIELQQDALQTAISRSGRKVYFGDFQRHRPTKRMTTVRSFAVTRNWVNEQNERPPNEGSSTEIPKNAIELRTDVAKTQPSEITHKPLGFEDVSSLSKSELNDMQEDYVSCDGANDVSFGDDKNSTKDAILCRKTPLNLFEKSQSQNISLLSLSKDKKSSSLTRRKKPQSRNIEKENSRSNSFHEETYEAQRFVRLFNAYRGRKGRVADITDLDVILTNVEEIALEIKSHTDSAFNKKMIREAFVQLKDMLSEKMDIYNEMRRVKLETKKLNTKLEKRQQELANVQDERKRVDISVKKLLSENIEIEKQVKNKQNANDFLTEFKEFQEEIRMKTM